MGMDLWLLRDYLDDDGNFKQPSWWTAESANRYSEYLLGVQVNEYSIGPEDVGSIAKDTEDWAQNPPTMYGAIDTMFVPAWAKPPSSRLFDILDWDYIDRLRKAKEQRDVLDKGYVRLVDHMGSDQRVIDAARVSTQSDGDGERDLRLLRFLWDNKHTSPFEHVEFEFEVKAPIMVFWQWARHRTWSYNVQSGRYGEYDENDYYVPDWRPADKDKELDPAFKASVSAIFREHYNQGFKLYQAAMDYGISREVARVFLPAFAQYIKFYAKVDLHNLLHFLRLRYSPHAQYEIRCYAAAIYDIISYIVPEIMKMFAEELTYAQDT